MACVANLVLTALLAVCSDAMSAFERAAKRCTAPFSATIAITSPAGDGRIVLNARSLRPARPFMVCSEPACKSKKPLRGTHSGEAGAQGMAGVLLTATPVTARDGLAIAVSARASATRRVQEGRVAGHMHADGLSTKVFWIVHTGAKARR